MKLTLLNSKKKVQIPGASPALKRNLNGLTYQLRHVVETLIWQEHTQLPREHFENNISVLATVKYTSGRFGV